VNQIINPAAFFSLLVLCAIGVAFALPRRGTTPALLGAALAGLAGGLLMLAMGVKAGVDRLPNIYFYLFSAIAIGAALRVITHPRPVYSALYFILTVIASGGLFLILSAEFMAFALIIVYAGAILITYLFVIMLATQAPEEGQEDVLAEYDTNAREPIAATIVGFVLLGALTTMVFRGLPQLSPARTAAAPSLLLEQMPRKVERVLQANKILTEGDVISRSDFGAGLVEIKAANGIVKELRKSTGEFVSLNEDSSTNEVLKTNAWPPELTVTNSEMLGFNLLRDHPGTIEIAGVILLMAMLGAVVLSRKQVQLDDEAKMRQVTALAQGVESRDPVMQATVEPVQQPGSSGPMSGGAA
jgi:NADH-quinone oxidoreductase subunit J